MKFKYLRRLRDPEGKGLLGCMVMIVLIGVAIYLGDWGLFPFIMQILISSPM